VAVRDYLAVAVALVLWSAAALAQQQVDSYEIRYYNAGAAQPFQLFPLPAGSYACNQTPTISTLSSNPNAAEWDDPNANGRVCHYQEIPGGPLLSFPIGNYEATLRAFNIAGASPESNRAPFVVGALPGAPTNFKIVR
jgi:hypothetical protein